MSKTIVHIDQISDGGTNPETNIMEEVLWTLEFDNNGGTRTLGRSQMLEYLTAGTSPIKNVHSFKKWEIKTRLGHTIRTWVIVYDDKSHVQLNNDSFYSLLTNGHRNKEEEKKSSTETEEVIESQRGAISKAIQQAQEEAQAEKITSKEDKEKVEAFRDSDFVRKGEGKESFHEEIRKDYYSHPDAKGYEDKH